VVGAPGEVPHESQVEIGRRRRTWHAFSVTSTTDDWAAHKAVSCGDA
jgi:hypothetical protein